MDAFNSKLKLWAGSFGDPRLFQIFSLGILLAAGAYFRDFSIRPEQVVLTFAAGLLEAYPVEAAHIAQRHHHLPQPDAAAARR
jgi:hypothetical protein